MRRWIDEGYLVAKGVPAAAVTYLELADKAAERIYLACQRARAWREARQGDPRPLQSQAARRASSTSPPQSPCAIADPRKSQVNAVVCDSDWEAELARVHRAQSARPRLREEPGPAIRGPLSRRRDVPRRYVPDFIVRIDDGGDEPLNLDPRNQGLSRRATRN